MVGHRNCTSSLATESALSRAVLWTNHNRSGAFAKTNARIRPLAMLAPDAMRRIEQAAPESPGGLSTRLLRRRRSRLIARRAVGDVALFAVAREERRIALGRIPITAAAGQLDFHPSVGGNGLLLLRVIGPPAVKQYSAAGAGFAAEKALRGNHRAVAHRRASEWFARPHAKSNRLPETAAILTSAAGIRTQLFLLDEYRRDRLDNFDRRADDSRRKGGRREAVLDGPRSRPARCEKRVGKRRSRHILARHLDSPDARRTFGHHAAGQGL